MPLSVLIRVYPCLSVPPRPLSGAGVGVMSALRVSEAVMSVSEAVRRVSEAVRRIS